MSTGKVYENDDIESLVIDIDKILGDESVKTPGRNSKHRGSAEQNDFDGQKLGNGSLSAEGLEKTSVSRLWLGINQYFPDKKSFQESPPRGMTEPPEDLVLHDHQDDEISTTLTEDMLYRTSSHHPEKVEFQDDDRHTDETARSNEETLPTTLFHTFGKQYKYAGVLATLLLVLICGLSVALASLDQHKTDSTNTNYQNNDDSMNEDWALRPTLPPFTLPRTINPSPTPSASPTRRPTPVPSKQSPAPSASVTRPPTPAPTKPELQQETGKPSPTPPIWDTQPSTPAPTKSEPLHLMELLQSTTSEKTIEAIGISGTAQQKAYEWLSKDPSYFTYEVASKIQRFSLAVLYFSTVTESTMADELETWLDYNTHECSWFMSSYQNRWPCGSDGVFKFLSLRNINLTGKIPSELGLLSNLVALVLDDNALTGTIPQEFGEWASLETLDLHGNFLSGRLPIWKNAPRLKEINLSMNTLTGSVPASIGNLGITSLDLTKNPNLVGTMPFELCSSPSQIEILAADCDLVYCSCCTQCNFNETATPSTTPTTTPPTRTPTVAPSLHPTMFPTVSTPSPTRPLPTPQPTWDPNCIDNVHTSKQCYMVGEPIDVIYSNCNPTLADWIGIYGVDTPESALLDPLLSHPTCINEPCSSVQQISTVVLDENSRGSSNGPLPSGRYVVFMFRGGPAVGPYTFFSKTLAITVAETPC